MTMTPDEIRESFLKFFEERTHAVVPSSPVIPQGDPTLMFANAGMNQFKDVLLGNEVREYTRAASVQKCVRAGGKHNDLDDVGRDGRHLTFFEMLGNWSFGDYYKRESIEWAWEYATQVLKLETERIYITVHHTDDTSEKIWLDEIGVPRERVLAQGITTKENFWSMGDTGPCGPCTEMHYDLHPELGPFEFTEGGYDEDRVVEFWNVVFMESNRLDDGSLTDLPLKSVDTGLGLDRMAMIKAGQDNVFKTGLFSPMLLETAELAGITIGDVSEIWSHDHFADFAVIADHIRTVTFALTDGATFSNTGRGSVLRSIARRAMRHGRNLGLTEPFLHTIAGVVVETYKGIYPELEPLAGQVARLIQLEEEQFRRTLDRGITKFESTIASAREAGRTELGGEEVYDLYQTYGFPVDMTRIMAMDLGFTVDEEGVLEAERVFKGISGAKNVYDGATGVGDWTTLTEGPSDVFVGYTDLETTTHVRKLRHVKDDLYELTLAATPFYAESGGQVSDAGTVKTADGSITFAIEDAQKVGIGRAHTARLINGTVDQDKLKEPVVATVDPERRALITHNHTATHLLHAALHAYVSEDATQQGSLVAPDRLRFDFLHNQPVTPDELREMEQWVNAQVRAGRPVVIHEDVPVDVATGEMGAMALFGEKYGDAVRVVDIPGASSVELCGGTHVSNTQEIGVFRITSESGVAAGVRRIEAVTQAAALRAFEADRQLVRDIADAVKSDLHNVLDRVKAVEEERRELKRRVDQLTQQIAQAAAGNLVDEATDIDGLKVLAEVVSVQDRDALKQYADKLRDQLDEGVVLLGAELDGKAALLCMVTDAAFKGRKIKAGDLVKAAAVHVDGRGGGKPTLAQAGGQNPAGLQDAIDAFEGIVRAALG